MTDNETLTKLVQWCRDRANEKAAEVYYPRENQAAEIAYDHVADHIEELLGGNND